jgi:hypothetical protein
MYIKNETILTKKKIEFWWKHGRKALKNAKSP